MIERSPTTLFVVAWLELWYRRHLEMWHSEVACTGLGCRDLVIHRFNVWWPLGSQLKDVGLHPATKSCSLPASKAVCNVVPVTRCPSAWTQRGWLQGMGLFWAERQHCGCNFLQTAFLCWVASLDSVSASCFLALCNRSGCAIAHYSSVGGRSMLQFYPRLICFCWALLYCGQVWKLQRVLEGWKQMILLSLVRPRDWVSLLFQSHLQFESGLLSRTSDSGDRCCSLCVQSLCIIL